MSGDAKAKIKAVIEDINKRHAIINIQGKIVIINFGNDPISGRETLSFSSKDGFNLWYGNEFIFMEPDEKGKIKRLRYSTLWLESKNRRQYKGLVFDPANRPHHDFYNLWKGFAIKPKKGKCPLYYAHIWENIAEGKENIYNYILDWMADAVQNPIDLPGVAMVLRGGSGAGKGTLIKLFGMIFGNHYQHVSNSRHVVGNFNSHLKDCLLLFADEAFFAGDKQHESTLKTIITEDTRQVEYKGKDVLQFPNYTRLMMASNKAWVVPLEIDDRRFFILDVADKYKNQVSYFDPIYKEMKEKGGLSALLYDLLARDLSNTNLTEIPETQARIDHKLLSLDTVGDWLSFMLADDSRNLQNIPIASLYEGYLKNCGKKHNESMNGWSRKIRGFFPGLKRYQFSDGSRYYEFPPLDEARELFESKIGHKIDWDRI